MVGVWRSLSRRARMCVCSYIPPAGRVHHQRVDGDRPAPHHLLTAGVVRRPHPVLRVPGTHSSPPPSSCTHTHALALCRGMVSFRVDMPAARVCVAMARWLRQCTSQRRWFVALNSLRDHPRPGPPPAPPALSDAVRPQVHAHRQRAAPGPEAVQHPA